MSHRYWFHYFFWFFFFCFLYLWRPLKPRLWWLVGWGNYGWEAISKIYNDWLGPNFIYTPPSSGDFLTLPGLWIFLRHADSGSMDFSHTCRFLNCYQTCPSFGFESKWEYFETSNLLIFVALLVKKERSGGMKLGFAE